jgi:tetratricopeptide (TPR) repeat protein
MALNPVERRLSDLCGDWVAFRDDPKKRLLVWKVPDDAARLLQCFFEVQKYDTPYTSGDLFINLDAAFDNSIQYSRELKEALFGQYEASRQDLMEEGIEPAWRANPEQFPDSAYGFIQTLRSFGSTHHKSIGHLVVVLIPLGVSSPDALSAWMMRALDAGIPERLRLAVIDSTANPQLGTLADSGDPRILVQAPDIDPAATAQETFAQEPTVGPAGVFRNYLMGLITLVEKGSLEQVKAKAADAQGFARKEGWLDQEVVVATLVGGALLKEGRFDEAVATHHEARQAATKAVASGHPAGQQLVLQTWYGEAGVHLAAGRLLEAARCYDEAASISQQSGNLILAIEAFRMGVFCHVRLNQREEALMRGNAALKVGARLKAKSRAMTTLPIAAMDLLCVIEPERAEALKHVKHEHDAREAEIRTAVEARAVEIDKIQNFALIPTVEDNLKTDLQNAENEASNQLAAVADRSGTEFRRTFTASCDLLGPDWPLTTAAIPRMPPTDEARRSKGVTAA